MSTILSTQIDPPGVTVRNAGATFSPPLGTFTPAAVPDDPLAALRTAVFAPDLFPDVAPPPSTISPPRRTPGRAPSAPPRHHTTRLGVADQLRVAPPRRKRHRRGSDSEDMSAPRPMYRPIGADYIECTQFQLGPFIEAVRSALPPREGVAITLSDASVSIAVPAFDCAAAEVGGATVRRHGCCGGICTKFCRGIKRGLLGFARAWIGCGAWCLPIGAQRRIKAAHAEVAVLRNLRFSARPGETTIVLGPPRSGKTTLLALMSGRFTPIARSSEKGILSGAHRKPVVKGLTYSEAIDTQREFAIADSTDAHEPLLPVGDTLRFALACRGVVSLSSALAEGTAAAPGDIEAGGGAGGRKAHRKHPPKGQREELEELLTLMILRVMGLTEHAATIVGSATVRGISGGQRRRVTVGEAWASDVRAFFVDELATGLDAVTTLELVRSLRVIAAVMHIPVVVSLLQPSAEVFALFDQVVVLSRNTQIYAGPTKTAVEWFEARAGVSKLPSMEQAAFLEAFAAGDQAAAAESWFLSETSVPPALPFDPQAVHHDEKLGIRHVTKREAIAFPKQVALLTRRELRIMWSERSLVLVNAVLIPLINGFFTGTLFWLSDENQSGVIMRRGLFFLVAFGAIAATLPHATAQQRRMLVVAKHLERRLHSPASYCVMAILTAVPRAAVESILYMSLLYATATLRGSAAAFFAALTLMLLLNIFLVFLGRTVGAATRNPDKAVAIMGAITVASVVLSGFLIYRPQIAVPLRWLIWASPAFLMFSGLATTQYYRLDISCEDADELGGCHYRRGGEVLDELGLPYTMATYWVALLGLLAWAVVAILAFLFTLVVNRKWWFSSKSFDPALLASGVASTAAKQKKKEEPLPPPPTAACANATVHGGAHVHDAPAIPNAQIGAIPQAPKTLLAFQDLSYSVPVDDGEKFLLQNVNGYFQPGTITALMGASGAGKSTLMDVLARRKTIGTTTGAVRVNGQDLPDGIFRRMTGYCEQMDIHTPQHTVRESVLFSARLRGPPLSYKARTAFVDAIIGLLELTPLRHRRFSSLSREAQKRLTVAVELAANAPVLFLDEPTSGLDGAGAHLILRLLRQVAALGRTIVCTIHTPPLEVFLSFDRLLLLRPGGQVVYNGPVGVGGSEIARYFFEAGALLMPSAANPADFALDAVGRLELQGHDTAALWAASSQAADASAEVAAAIAGKYGSLTPVRGADGLMHSPPLQDAPPVEVARPPTSIRTKQVVVRWIKEVVVLTARNAVVFFRSPAFGAARLATTVFLVVLFSWAFFWMDYETVDIASRVGLCYGAAYFMGVAALMTISSWILSARPVFARERASLAYGAVPYMIAVFLAELPFLLFYSILFVVPVYFLTNLVVEWWRFILFWGVFVLFQITCAAMAIFIAAVVPTADLAQSLAPAAASFLSTFAGFLLPRPLIPDPYLVIFAINPYRYIFEGAMFSQFHDVVFNCSSSAFQIPEDELVIRTPLPLNATTPTPTPTYPPLPSFTFSGTLTSTPTITPTYTPTATLPCFYRTGEDVLRFYGFEDTTVALVVVVSLVWILIMLVGGALSFAFLTDRFVAR